MDPHDSADPRPPVNETTGYSNAKPTDDKGRKVTEHATGAGTITGHDRETREKERERDKAEDRDRHKGR